MKLVYYPDDVLFQKCEPVLTFDQGLHDILDGMKTIMLEKNGIGLSANQVGITKKIMLIMDTKKQVYEMINPIILETDGAASMAEGCLSSPGVYLAIDRPASVMLQYTDRNGEIKKVIAEGVEARCILHEMDHLNGIFYFSKVNRTKRKTAIAQLKKTLK